MAVARALGEAAGLAVRGQAVPHGRGAVSWPHVPGPAEPVGLPGSEHAHAQGGTDGASVRGGGGSSAAERLGLPPPGAGGSARAAVRFELAGSHGQAGGGTPPAGSGGPATFVMLPQPARFDISKMPR